jgi:hypothetical protein
MIARTGVCDNGLRADRHWFADPHTNLEDPMSKRARKRRSRKGNKANHGRKPNA